MLAGWINRHQQAVIAYQKEEIKVLREMLGGKRLRFTDEQRVVCRNWIVGYSSGCQYLRMFRRTVSGCHPE